MEEKCRASADEKEDKEDVWSEEKKVRGSKEQRKKKKRRKGRKRPYSEKNFLQRPKINAPANTTQFLCADKDYYMINQENFAEGAPRLLSSSVDSESPCSGSSTSTRSSSIQSELDADSDPYENVFWDSNDRFFLQEFERLYDDVRVELLCSKTAEELSACCTELETAVQNLQYLLQRETRRRQNMEEMLDLLRSNAELTRENNNLRRLQRPSLTNDSNRSDNG